MNILDKEYRENNNINSANRFNYITKLDGNYNFSAKKILYEDDGSNSNIKKYYVYGYLIKDTMNKFVEKQEYFLIVKLDLNNNLFSVIPYNGTIFNEVG